MAHFHKLEVDHFSFSEFAGTALARVLREGGSSTRIDIVFDVYINLSIKSVETYNVNSTRTERPRRLSITYNNLPAKHRIKQFRNFLQISQNKYSLIQFMVDLRAKPSSRAKDKQL